MKEVIVTMGVQQLSAGIKHYKTQKYYRITVIDGPKRLVWLHFSDWNWRTKQSAERLVRVEGLTSIPEEDHEDPERNQEVR